MLLRWHPQAQMNAVLTSALTVAQATLTATCHLVSNAKPFSPSSSVVISSCFPLSRQACLPRAWRIAQRSSPVSTVYTRASELRSFEWASRWRQQVARGRCTLVRKRGHVGRVEQPSCLGPLPQPSGRPCANVRRLSLSSLESRSLQSKLPCERARTRPRPTCR